jgi:hypothetical protein
MIDIRFEKRNDIEMKFALNGYSDWHVESNRKFPVRFPLGVALSDEESLITLSSLRGLESIRFVSLNALNALMTCRVQRQQQVASISTETLIFSFIRGTVEGAHCGTRTSSVGPVDRVTFSVILR